MWLAGAVVRRSAPRTLRGRPSTVEQCLSVLSPDKTQMSFLKLPSVFGVVKKRPRPGGDFVPAGVAGADYVSPGYVNQR